MGQGPAAVGSRALAAAPAVAAAVAAAGSALARLLSWGADGDHEGEPDRQCLAQQHGRTGLPVRIFVHSAQTRGHDCWLTQDLADASCQLSSISDAASMRPA